MHHQSPGLNTYPSSYLYLINPRTGADYTFVTDSYGGRKGVGRLKSKITNVRMGHPAAVPVVKCTTAPMKTQYGMKKRPEFEVIGWRNADGFSAGKTPNNAQPKLVEKPKSHEPEFEEDEIPF
jgi:hypothetical protein